MNIVNSSEDLSPTQRGRLADMTKKWAFPIGDGYAWMDDWARSFCSVDVSILRFYDDDRPPAYAFSSPHLTDLSAEDATSRARALMKLLNGLIRAEKGLFFYGFEISRCVDLDTDSNATVSEHKLRPVDAFPDGVEQLRYFETEARNLSSEGCVLFVARIDKHLRYILEVMGEGISFVNYYKILDAIKDSGLKKEEDIARLGGKSKSDIKDFTFTANKFQASGIASRHGFEEATADAKSKSLTLEEADDIMRPIVVGFINKRVKEKFSQEWSKVQIQFRHEAD